MLATIHASPMPIRQEGTMTYRFHHTIVLATVLCAAGSFMQLNASMQVRPHVVSAAPLDSESLDMWPFFIVGALLGGFAIVGFRRLKDREEAARYFGVSFAGSCIISGFIVYDMKVFGLVTEPRWHTIVCIAGGSALLSWTLLEGMTLLTVAAKKAYDSEGIAGLRNFVLLVLSVGIIRIDAPRLPTKEMRNENGSNENDTNSDSTASSEFMPRPNNHRARKKDQQN